MNEKPLSDLTALGEGFTTEFKRSGASRLGGTRLMYKYEIILYWSNADGVFVAEVPELPGCMAHGDTTKKPRSNTSIRQWSFGSTPRASSAIQYQNPRANV